MPSPALLVAAPVIGAPQPDALTTVPDAESLFARLFDGAHASFWLDAGPLAEHGWSILGTGALESDAHAVRAVSLAGETADDRPVPFAGGWVGWLTYEEGARALGVPAAGDGSSASGHSDTTARWIAVTHAVAIDHGTGRVFALASAAQADAWAQRVSLALAAAPLAQVPPASTTSIAHARHGAGEYRDMVDECRAAIARGDAYQLCLTTRFTTDRPDNPYETYRRLRRATPSHHGGYLRAGAEHLLSASPEQFLSASGGVVSTSPIKGTRPRGAEPGEDARLAEELRNDVKERAENVMIVDLMRNDLSRISRPGSVTVERLWQVESYPAVHQLVSTVSAELRDDSTVGELCDATFPAGSMTGAPKISAMTILHSLERAPRGVYSGCFGYVDLRGRVDLAMVIRSVVVTADEAYVGAGGGITWLSQAPAEAAEVATKARAPLAALGARLPDEWDAPA